VVTALTYDGVVRRVILALKEQNRTDLAAALAGAQAVAIAAALGRDPGEHAGVEHAGTEHAGVERAGAERAGAELVAVPTSRAAYRTRGYDPLALILRRAHIQTHPVLVHVRSTRHQKTLGSHDREQNLRGAMAARHRLTERRFIIVDDILTTGSTMAEASRAISAAGGEVVGGVCLAFTPRMFHPEMMRPVTSLGLRTTVGLEPETGEARIVRR